MYKAKAILLFILIMLLTLTGCGLGAAPQKTPAPLPVPQQAASALPTDSSAVSLAVQAAVRAFLSNDFAAAQKSMLLLPAEQNDPKTKRMFTDYSLHLNKRLALEAKDAGLKSPEPSIAIDNIRVAENAGMLADVSIRATTGLKPLTMTVKTTQTSGIWMVDFAPFMLALTDALDEEQ